MLPKQEKVTDLVLKWCHAKCAHGGRGATLNELRRSGYWMVNGNSAVGSKMFKCIQCRRLRRKLGIQKMANLPSSRLMEVPPFTYCRVDMFGPFIIKQRRSEAKWYGAMFTCMNSRAVQIEVTHSLDTDSFIQALRQIIARRGNIKTIFSDNGSNFIGADNELKRAFEEMDNEKIQAFKQEFGGDWIKWKWNPPVASHLGGAWERQIRSAQRILSSLLQTHGKAFGKKSLLTLMVETEGILNSRPFTVETISDRTSELPLSPANILTRKSKVAMPPPGKFSKQDLYISKKMETYSACNKKVLVALKKRVSAATPRKKEVAWQKAKFPRWWYCTTSRWWFEAK